MEVDKIYLQLLAFGLLFYFETKELILIAW